MDMYCHCLNNTMNMKMNMNMNISNNSMIMCKKVQIVGCRRIRQVIQLSWMSIVSIAKLNINMEQMTNNEQLITILIYMQFT